ncbi:MAG: Eco57I restriction-modification methylase domain-containing protein [Cloacibacterium sp.]
MKEKDLKHKLQQTFDFSIWKEILPLFFKKIDYFSQPENLFTNNENIIESKQVGTVKLDDGKQLAIFLVEVSDNINIVRNRQGLREIAAKYIDQNIIHGALAFFYNKNQVDYRFSFIAKEASLDLETGELIKGETKPKRYTYLLGANEACTTAAKRMLVLADKKEKGEVSIKELKEVFSVEALNKDFFKTYKAHYEKFWKYLADENNPFRTKLIDEEKDTKDKQEKPIRDFVKKLLGRIVFLQFLEKKGWMGCDASSKEWTGGNPRFMFQLFEDFSEPEKFHSQCLTKLFFETLNTKRPNDIFEIKGLNGKLNGSRVPYLNGGLFEPEKNKATLAIDFPADYFKELLEFFDQYNFTIDENSPDDHEVGIDPEMLGHIFENLLEDNRDKGAFYTPKEIVQYMCKESLIQYLLNTFQEQKDIEQFIRLHIVSPFLAEKENAILLNQKLDDIKVCDPAIGSGAFPIGMLQEIFEAKRFIYPYLKTNQDFKPAAVKKNIIQNSIYGVDLEKGAVDIAQLRFWLSLVVDELNPHPLPNLDYKIMQGNSLLESFEGVDLSKMGNNKSDLTIAEPQRDLFGNLLESQMKMTFSKIETTEKIQQLIKRFFSIEKAEDKKAIRDEINQLVLQHIEYNIELRENQLNRFINEAGNPNNLNKNAKKKYDGYVADLDKIQATKANLLKIQETDERPYFLWHLYFKDVFDQGGFDVMIGNPPYIQLQKDEGYLANTYENKGFETFVRTGDIYSLFYEKGLNLLKEEGNLNYITSNKWLKANYGKATREFFLKHQPIKIIDLGSGIFKTATVDTNILIIKKLKNSLGNKSVLGLNISKESIIKDINDFKDRWVFIENLSSDSWAILDKEEFEIKKKIENIGKPLNEWENEIYRGVLTGLNEAFIIENETKEKLCQIESNNQKIIKPILKGKNIKKYKAKWDGLWLIETHNGYKKLNGEIIPPIDINDFPRVKEYLDTFEPKLSNRGDKGVTPYNLRNCAYQEEFTKEKIVWADIAREPSFSYLGPNIYFNNTVYFIVGDSLKYLLTVLNSRVIDFYFQKIGTDLGQDGGRYFKQFVELFPIPDIEEMYRKPFETLAEYLIYLNAPKQAPVIEKVSNEAVSQVFEDLVNMMVYELYFEEEMKAKEIDVLQFVTEKAFPDITQAEDPKAIIQKVYYELQQKDNPIRNRILAASSRSETIARINAATS